MIAALLIAFAQPCHAEGPKIGFSIRVEGDGFFLNPLVTKILVTDVEKGSLADGAGIVAGDEIMKIEGQAVVGKRARDLQPFMRINPGETRTLHLKHANGEQFNARITMPQG